jgi:hypothetical protein
LQFAAGQGPDYAVDILCGLGPAIFAHGTLHPGVELPAIEVAILAPILHSQDRFRVSVSLGFVARTTPQESGRDNKRE